MSSSSRLFKSKDKSSKSPKPTKKRKAGDISQHEKNEEEVELESFIKPEDQKNDYPPITNETDITQLKKFSSVGTHREAILVDREKIEKFKPFQNFIAETEFSTAPTPPDANAMVDEKSASTGSRIVPSELLPGVIDLARKGLETTTEADIKKIVQEYNDINGLKDLSNLKSAVPLIFFFDRKKRFLYCRHIAPFTACILAKLIEMSDFPEKQKVFCFKTKVKFLKDKSDKDVVMDEKTGNEKLAGIEINHAMVLYIDANQTLFLIDASLNFKPVNITELLTKEPDIQKAELEKACHKKTGPNIDVMDLFGKIQDWHAKLTESPTKKLKA